MNTTHILVREEGPLTRVVLNRPDKRNALSLALMNELTPALRSAKGRAIVLEGAGPCFSAGHDLSEMTDRDLSFYQELVAVCTVMMETLQDIPQPVIAKVHGIATAAGCQLVAACDLAIAAAGTRFATPGVKIGLFCSTPMVEISRAVGRKRAMELLMTGVPIDADTAAEWGLVNRVVAADSLESEVVKLAESIAASSAFTVGLGKQAFYRQIELDKHQAYGHTKVVMAQNAMAADAQEGIGAFLAKRAPVWRDR